MKKLYTLLIVLVMCCTMLLAGCGFKPLDYPGTNEIVIGNGGTAVIKGNYLYYINGYMDASTFTDYRTENVYGKEVRGAIYKTVLDANGQVQRSESGKLEETEVVVPKVVGFNTGGFYIIGDYLYYVTPLMENAYPDGNKKEPVLQKDRMEICRIKLDGTGNERLTVTETAISDASTKFNWAVYTIEGKTQVVYLDGTNLISFNATDKTKVTMAEGVSNIALLKQANYDHENDALTGDEQFVYYTRSVGENDTDKTVKNVFAKTKIGTSEEILVASSTTETYAIKEVKNDRIYYTKSEVVGSQTLSAKLYVRTVGSTIETKLSDASYSYSYILDSEFNGNGLSAVVIDSNNYIYRLTNGSDNARVLVNSAGTSITPLGLNGSYLYFVENSQVYRIDCMTAGAEKEQLTSASKTYFTTSSSLIDFDGRRIFVFAQYSGTPTTNEEGEEVENTNYYMNVIDLTNIEDTQFVGDFAEDECPEEPEECEHEDHLEEECPNDGPWIL